MSKVNKNYVEVIKKATVVIEEVKEFREPELECGDLMGIYEWEGIVRDLDWICEKVEKIAPHSGYEYLPQTAIKNSKS